MKRCRPAEQLTPLEMDYLRMVAYTNKQIANELRVSVRTVISHWRVIALKLHVGGGGPKRARIIVRALRNNMISVDELRTPPIEFEEETR